MSDLPPPGSLVRQQRSARRPELLEQLIVALTSGGAGEGSRLALRDRSADEPTVALLDAWATVADVIGFYLDRIWAEGFIATAVEPGSILALASLVGHRPRPGLAARLYLAYTLNLDPADKAIALPAGMLSQSVPGPGEQPQTFETTAPLVARPSWSLLAAKTKQPLTVPTPADAAKLSQIVVGGTTARLSPNDLILLAVTEAPKPMQAPAQMQVQVRVASAVVDQVAQVTTVALQAQLPVAEGPTGDGPKHPPPPSSDLAGAIDGLLVGGLGTTPAPVPRSAGGLARTVESSFGPRSDAIPRLLTALRPDLAPTLYGAFASTVIGAPALSGAAVMRVKAAPFGAQAPPRTLFDASGQPVATEPWPIGETHRLEFRMTEADFRVALHDAVHGKDHISINTGVTPRVPVLSITCTASQRTGNGQLSLGGALPLKTDLLGPAVLHPSDGDPPGMGTIELSITAGSATVMYRGNDQSLLASLELTALIDPTTGAITLQFGDSKHQWDPDIRTPIRVAVGPHRLSIVWSVGRDTESSVTVSIETPLALLRRDVLALDAIYEGILAGTTVVIEQASAGETPPAAQAIRDVPAEGAQGTPVTDGPGGAAVGPPISYPLIARVNAVERAAVSGFGSSGIVTRLTLDRDWISSTATLQSELGALTVRAQPDALELQPVDIESDVNGDTIELALLIAGMDVGRPIIVAGTRADLPAGASVEAGEVAMVAEIVQGSGSAAPGDQPHTTLRLTAPLAYAYRRDSLRIYGNVVAAHQGATLHEILGSGMPSQAHQTFTLSSAPVLADPASTPDGEASTLTVTVDGVGYQEVARFEDSTPPRSFMTGADAQGHTTIAFAAPLPTGTGNVHASYRAGDGSQGNVRPHQVTQLLSRPSGVAGVENPLQGFGGGAGDGPEKVRTDAPKGLRGLGRIVTVSDYADLASSYAGVGKAAAELAGDCQGGGVLVTIAGVDPAQLDPAGALCTSVAATISAAADPVRPLTVAPAALFVIVLGASVTRDPTVGWDDTASAVRAALLARFGYPSRELGQDVVLSDLIAAAHAAPSVRSFTVTSLALVPATVTASQLVLRLPELLTQPVGSVTSLRRARAEWGPPAGSDQLAPAGVAYLSDAVADTLILSELTP